MIDGNPVNEKEASTKLLYILRNKYVNEGWLYKFTDASAWTKPFDVFAIIKWFAIGIELKYIRLKRVSDVEKTTRGMLEPHQMLNLKKIENAWGCGYIWAYVEVEKTFYLFPFTNAEKENI